ncbi:MAG TPA: 16S rRNA (adenine(1518)-N(6)/adenine(1519)-N(6))-dimethyltransferase RsmA [Stellaceae bacterium]|nr:16S rRNA (adenine(1518)-N(6)/adenine(1519)-N(6))-dimethyltransferase RsmA [Stellaceae bacterium]
MPELPPLREVIRRHGLAARKSLGQNFLLDLNLIARIARAAAPLEGVNVVEIGPGPGGLTRALLEQGAATVTAIERDERCVAALQELVAAYPGRLAVVSADALEVDPARLVPAPRKIAANLPYNIATALLLRWLPRIGDYESLTLMFQKEVAARLTAAPRSRDYGRLSVLVQWLAEVRRLFDVPARAFVPAPKVTSTLVRIEARPEPLAPCRREDLERVTAAAFGQRRKMLRQSLKSLPADPARLAAAAGVDPTRRAETIPVSGFVAMARELTNSRAETKP